LLEKKVCHSKECLFGELLDKVNQEIKDYLSQNRLSDLIRLEKERSDDKKKASNCKD